MPEFLQDLSFDEEHTIKTINVEYIISFEHLSPEQISTDLRIQPSRAWKKGDLYEGRVFDPKHRLVTPRISTRPTGIWALETKTTQSLKVEDHLNVLLDLLDPKKETIKAYLADPANYYIKFFIWCEYYAEHGSYTISTRVLKKVSELSHDIELSVITNVAAVP